MKLYSRNTGKWIFAVGMSVFAVLICSVLLFSGLGLHYRTAYADGGATATGYTKSLTGLTSASLDDIDSDGVFEIDSVDDLRALAFLVNNGGSDAIGSYATKSYRLTADLDLSGYAYWEPIGTATHPFSGAFDGNGKSIYGLTIIDEEFVTGIAPQAEGEATAVEESYAGLFGYVKCDSTASATATISKLGLKDALIKTKSTYTGGLIGRAEGSATETGKVSVSECYVTGYIEGSDYVGGVIGSMEQCACLEYSYFAGSVREDARYLDDCVNATFDVATNVDGGIVGGLAGYASENSKNCKIISNCYNAGVVGGAGTTDFIRGALVGLKSDLLTSNLRSNLFLKITLPNATSSDYTAETGKSKNAVDLSKITVNSSFMRGVFDEYDYAAGDNYVPTSPTKKWQWSSKVNNGLPYLLNTPQLVSIEFVTQVVDANGNNIETVNSTDISNSVVDTDYRLKSGDKYFVSINKGNIVLTSAVTPKSDADYSYKLYGWATGAVANSVSDKASNMGIVASTTETSGVADKDKIFVAKYTERTYAISFTEGGTSNMASSLVVKANGETLSSPVKYNAQNITLEATAKAGYKLTGIVTPSVAGEFVTSANGVYTLKVADYIKAIGNASTEATADNINSLSVMAEFAPETYTIYYDSNLENCVTAPYVVKGENTMVTTGASIAYGDTIRLCIDGNCIAQNYVFAGWKYQILDSGDQPNSNSWTPIEETREDSIGFTMPDAEDGQKIWFRADFKKVTYTVATQYDALAGEISLQNNTGDTLNYNSFDFDAVVYVKIKANDGYQFSTVTINGTPYNKWGISGSGATWEDDTYSRLIFNGLTRNMTVAVDFLPINYDVTFVLNSQNVTSTGTKVQNASGDDLLNSTTRIPYNQNIIFDVVVEEGFDLVSVSANSVALGANSENASTRTFGYTCRVTGNTEIKVVVKKKVFAVNARFEYADQYDYTVDDSCIHGANEYYYGQSVALSIDLPNMFVVESWVANGVTYPFNSPSTSFNFANIRENLDVVINLALRSATVVYSQIGDPTSTAWFDIIHKGTISAYSPTANTLTAKYGDQVQFKVADQYFEADGRTSMFTFAYWQVNDVMMTTDRTLSIRVDVASVRVEAVFRPAQIKVTAECYQQIVDPEGSLIQSDTVGSITGLNGELCSYGSTVLLEAVARDGYKFVAWYDEFNTNLASTTLLSLNITKPENIKAVFIKESNVAVLCDDAHGTISGAGKKVAGDIVVLNATPRAGYRFVAWQSNDDIVGQTSEFRFEMPARDVHLTAVFEKIYAVNYHVNDNSLGQVVGSTSGAFKENVTLEAISANNCSFVGWMIDNVMVSTATKLNLSLNGDVQVEALFKKNFDWNIVIIIVGIGIFAFVVVCGAVVFIRSKEAQPVHARALLGGKDDSDIIKKSSKRNALRDEIIPVPTRKQQRVNVQPVPVRKIVVEPTDHKGNKLKSTQSVNGKQKTLKTEDNE